MNKRALIAIVLTLAALLLAGGLRTTAAPGAMAVAPPLSAQDRPADRTPTQTGAQAAGQLLPAGGKEAGGGYAVQPGTAAGGTYRLASGGGADWSVRGVSSAPSGAAGGGGYRLEVLSAARVQGTGTPCCCSVLPCIVKGYDR